MQKKIPMRTCVVTKEKLPKYELVRVVRTPLGTVEVDLTSKKNGKGVYLKKDKEVFMKARKNNLLSRYLDTDVDIEVYDELDKLIV